MLRESPPEQWVYGLVSVGRYSQRFVEALSERWAQGRIGYEEVALPMACVQARLMSCPHLARSAPQRRTAACAQLGRARCEAGVFRRIRAGKDAWRRTMVDAFFRFRPLWECAALRHRHRRCSPSLDLT